MLHALGPTQIADVNQAVDALFDLDERAEVGQVANPAFDRRSDWVLVMQASQGSAPAAAFPAKYDVPAD